MEDLRFTPFKDSLTSTQVAILVAAGKQTSPDSMAKLQAQGPAEFREAQFHLKGWGLINARYELTARGRKLVNEGVFDQTLKEG